MSRIYPVILSGGVGSRLWPLSKADFPKQFQSLYSDKPMIVETALRVSSSVFEKPIVVCNEAHRFLVLSAFQDYQIDFDTIMLEPCLRDTAAAVASAACYIYNKDPEGKILILPSDHYMDDIACFQKEVFDAALFIQDKYIATFGIKPTRPETGYGYIKKGQIQSNSHIYQVSAFVEKPMIEVAKQYVACGDFLWNAGIFLSSVKCLLSELQKYEPEIYQEACYALKNSWEDLAFRRLDKRDFERIPKKSFDYAVMEKTKSAVVVPLDIPWNDLGSWQAISDISSKDDQCNYIHGDIVAIETSNSYIRSDSGLNIATIGVQDLVIVASDNSVIISDKEQVQKTKQVFMALQEQKNSHIYSGLVRQPWGYSKLVQSSDNFTAKIVVIDPLKKTASQKHKLRSEHWVLIEGEVVVVLNGVEKKISAGECISIIPEVVHAIHNRSTKPAKIFEVQSGVLKEDDIIRFEEAEEQASVLAL